MEKTYLNAREKTTIKEQLDYIEIALQEIDRKHARAGEKKLEKIFDFFDFGKNQNSIDEFLEETKTTLFDAKKELALKKRTSLGEKESVEHKETLSFLHEIYKVTKNANFYTGSISLNTDNQNLESFKKKSIALENFSYKINSILCFLTYDLKQAFSDKNKEGNVKHLYQKSIQLMQSDCHYNLEELLEDLEEKTNIYFSDGNNFEKIWDKMNTLITFDASKKQEGDKVSYKSNMLILYSYFFKFFNENIDRIEKPRDFFHYKTQEIIKETLEYLSLIKCYNTTETLINKASDENIKKKNTDRIYDYLTDEIYIPLLSSYSIKKEAVFNGFFSLSSRAYNLDADQTEMIRKIMSRKDVKESIAAFLTQETENNENYFYFYDRSNCSRYFVSIVDELWESNKKLWFELTKKMGEKEESNRRSGTKFYSPSISSVEFKEIQEKRKEAWLLTGSILHNNPQGDLKCVRF